MIKNILPFLIIALITFKTVAQEKKQTAYEAYADFNLARLQGESSTALEQGEALLDSVVKLTPKQRISFYNSMGTLYEDNKAPEKAIPYYQKVIDAVPNYYVAHLALGNILLKNVYELQTELANSNNQNNGDLKTRYKAAALEAVRHLEYAQACDPDDQTLRIIKALYNSMNDVNALNTLDARLAGLKQHCLDLLIDN